MKVLKGSEVVMESKRVRSLYYLEVDVIINQMNVVHKVDPDTWHFRLGHVSLDGVNRLIKDGVIEADSKMVSRSCEVCVLGKSKKLTYPSGKHTSKSALDYAHSDIWGPAQTTSVGGCRYFLSIVDDYSRKIWLYIMKEKSYAFSRFRDWCKEVEVEKNATLKCLRTDNGLEFLSNEFSDFCKMKGIKRHRTVPNNPQQNGVAERANRTILERVRCMLISSGMPARFWGEAAATAVVLMNKCPTSATHFQTPDFRWYGHHGNYTILISFGCRAYSHIKQGKLEPKAIKCVLLGYQTGVKGYRLWSMEPGMQKVVISRDVTFRESEMPFKEVEKDRSSERTNTAMEVELQTHLMCS